MKFIKILDWSNYCKIKNSSEDTYIKRVIEISRQKVQTLKELYEFSRNFFIDDFEYEEEFVKKIQCANLGLKKFIETTIDQLQQLIILK